MTRITACALHTEVGTETAYRDDTLSKFKKTLLFKKNFHGNAATMFSTTNAKL